MCNKIYVYYISNIRKNNFRLISEGCEMSHDITFYLSYAS